MKICEAGRDPCGCNNWSKGIRTINGQYPDDNRDFGIIAGDGIEVSPATAGIEISVKAPLPGPMVYRGTVGTGGTAASLPDANVENIGWTYVAVSAGSTPDDTPKAYQIGDMLISNGEEWTVIPAGDDPIDWSQIQNKPTTVSGYGITDAVDIGSAQTITGIKTFTEAKTTTRSYNAANITDIVTIGSLAANPDVVHTTGNETLSGTKVFLNSPFVKSTDIKPSDTSQTTTKWLNTYFIRGSDNNILGGIEYGMRTTGNRVIRLRLTKADGTYAYKTLFEIDNAGNVIV